MTGEMIEAHVSATRERKAKKHGFDDILYIIMGDSRASDALILLFTIIFFATVPVVMVLLFANYSGGMRWLLTLGLVSVLAIMAIYLMKRGLKRAAGQEKPEAPKTEFHGELTELSEMLQRGSAGYVYSQQLLRERICEDIINRLANARDMSSEDIISRFENGDHELLEDPLLAKFVERYRRGTSGWDKDLVGKGRSRERGRNFMTELELIIEKTEEIV